MSDSSLYIGSHPEKHPVLDRICCAVVASLRNYPGFDFLAKDEFENLVYQAANEQSDVRKRLDKVVGNALPEEALARHIERLAKGIYSQKLYHGCCSEQPSIQKRAFENVREYSKSWVERLMRRDTSLSDEEKERLVEECGQDVGLAIGKAIANVKGPGGFLRYIQTTSLNAFRAQRAEALEHSKNLYSPPSPGEDGASGVPPDPRPEREFADLLASLIAAELLRCFLDALDRLPPEDRWVLTVEAFGKALIDDDFSREHVAAALHLSAGNFSTKKSRALSKLRKDPRFQECVRLQIEEGDA